jgi:hypothetical protein
MVRKSKKRLTKNAVELSDVMRAHKEPNAYFLKIKPTKKGA